MQPIDQKTDKKTVAGINRNIPRGKRSSNQKRNENRADAAYADKSFCSSYKIYNSDNSYDGFSERSECDKKQPLPMSKAELFEQVGKDVPDFVLVTGDAYIDHPSFGTAIIGRVLLSHGYSVGIIAQPNWKSAESFKVFGKPRLGFLVNSGNMDSMVNHYTSAKKPRSEDAYTPGAASAGSGPIVPLMFTVNVSVISTEIFLSLSAALKRASAALLITIIGTTVFYLPFLYPQVRIC